MKTQSTFDRIRGRLRRQPEMKVWGDARALPFTEGQAVVGAGQIGPAQLPAEMARPTV